MRTEAVLGCGKRSTNKEGWAIGHSHGEAWRAEDPSLRVVAVDPSLENLAAFGERFGLAKEDLFASTESLYATMKTITLPLDTLFSPSGEVHHRPRVVMSNGRVILMADEHFGSAGRKGVVEAFRELTGQAPTLADASAGLVEADLLGAGLLVLYHTQPTVDETTQSLLRKWVSSGKPLLLVHAALRSWPNWDEYQKWCGRVWACDGPAKSQHPHELSSLQRIRQIPGNSWSNVLLSKDEAFIKLAQTSDCIDLVTVTIPQGTFPAAWQNSTH